MEFRAYKGFRAFRGLGDSGFRAVTKAGDCAIPSDENISTANDNDISHGLTRHLEQLLELNLERRAQSKCAYRMCLERAAWGKIPANPALYNTNPKPYEAI